MDVQQDVELVTDVESTWELLTRPEDLAAWLGEGARFEPVPGGTGSVVDEDGIERRIEVDEVSEHERIVWRWWRLDGDTGCGDTDCDATDTDALERRRGGNDAYEDGWGTSVSRVEITLQPTEIGTRLVVVETPLTTPTVMTACAGSTRAGRSARSWAGRIVTLELVGMLATATSRV